MKILKLYINMEKTIIKFGDIEIQKQKFLQHKGLISIKNVDIDKIVVSNKVPFGYKDAKKSNLYEYLSRKWLHIENTLTKLSKCLFS